MNNELFEFKVGDIVKCAFYGDELLELKESISIDYPLSIVRNGEKNTEEWFTKNGLLYDYHLMSALTLISRPKKMVKRVLYAWINIYPNAFISYTTRELADKNAHHDRIACVEIDQEFQVEEEE